MLNIPWPDGAAWIMEVAIERRVYRLRGSWNEVGLFWSLDVLTRTDEPISLGNKVVRGALMTARLADDRLPSGSFLVLAPGNEDRAPGRDAFTNGARLIYAPAV